MKKCNSKTAMYAVPYRKYQKLLNSSFTYNHYIYYDWYLDFRAGGPTGYLANLLLGLNKLTESSIDTPILTQFAIRLKQECVPPVQDIGIYRKCIMLLQKNRCFNSLYMNYLSRNAKQTHLDYLAFLKDGLNQRANSTLISKINLNKTRTIHVHEIADAVKVKNELIARGLEKKVKLIMTCHTPESAAKEYSDGYITQGYNKEKAVKVLNGWKSIERAAYAAADIMIYPSREAMEPAYKFIPDFDSLIQSKDIRFVATGVEAITPKIAKNEAKKKYHVEGKFVISYIGRHNSIKGYDILKEAAKKSWQTIPILSFLSAVSRDPSSNHSIILDGLNAVELIRPIFYLQRMLLYFLIGKHFTIWCYWRFFLRAPL